MVKLKEDGQGIRDVRRADGIRLRVWGLESGYRVQISFLPPTSYSTLIKVLTSTSPSAKWREQRFLTLSVIRTK